ncbi:MAG: hypothetical protein ACOY4U_11270 [Pseudomonadota bacterium]
MTEQNVAQSTLTSRLVTAFFCLLLCSLFSFTLYVNLVTQPLSSTLLDPEHAIVVLLIFIVAYVPGTLAVKILLNRPQESFFGAAFKIVLPIAISLIFLSTLASALVSGSIKKMSRGSASPDVIYSLSEQPIMFAMNCLTLVGLSATFAALAYAGYRSLTLRSTGDAVQAGSSSK